MSDEQQPQIAKAIQDISNSVSVLVSEEIALAKAEVSSKVSTLGRGGAIGVAAAVFLFFALILLMHSLAWGLYALIGVGVWLGYLLAAIIFILIGVAAGMLAAKLLKKSAPPVPTMAIEEAQEIKQAITDARSGAPTLAPTGNGTPATIEFGKKSA